MHPLIARIHPSFRTALVAWFVTRTLLWLVAGASGALPVADLWAAGFVEGAPGWSALAHLGQAIDQTLAGWRGVGAGAWALAALGELAVLASCVAVYRFVRREQLPQTADRATWLWAACPAMIFSLPAGEWTFAIAGVAVSLAALSASRHFAATAAIVAAMAFKPEAFLLWPGLAIMGFKNYQPGKQHEASPWLTALGPPAAFTGLVLLAMTLAGRFGISIRTLQSGTRWRESLAWQGFETHFAEIVLAGALLAGILLVVGQFKRSPKSWPLMSAPLLVWPFLHEPPTAAAAAVLFAVPFFAQLARALDDPNLERPILAGSLGGLLVLVVL